MGINRKRLAELVEESRAAAKPVGGMPRGLSRQQQFEWAASRIQAADKAADLADDWEANTSVLWKTIHPRGKRHHSDGRLTSPQVRTNAVVLRNEVFAKLNRLLSDPATAALGTD
jgi:hypothetical protein